MSNTILNKTFKNTGEKKLLNKFDVLYILFIVFLSFFLIFFGIFFVKKTGNRAIVKYNNTEIMAIGLNKNQVITLKNQLTFFLRGWTFNLKFCFPIVDLEI